MKRIMLMLVLAVLMLSISAVSAETNQTGNLTSFDDGDTVYLENTTYTESDIVIDKSVTVLGSGNATFDGQSKNSLFTIANSSQVTFKNVRFMNYKSETNGAVFNIEKSSTLILLNCTFTDNIMAISNYGSLYIYGSQFQNNSLTDEYTFGGAIANHGKLYIENSTFTDSHGCMSTSGATIYNNGDMTINTTTIANAYAGEDSKGSAIFNNGICLLVNSIIENNTIERYDFNYMHGAVYNQGNLTGIGNIFRKNTGKYVKPNTWYEGSPTIYNVGDISLIYNAFIGNVPFKGLSVDLFNNGARYISIDGNWWSGNENPIGEGKVNEGNEISSWIVLDLTPEYSALDINESVLIRASWKLNTGENIDESRFPKFSIMLTDGMTQSLNEFLFNDTRHKGTYTVMATVCDFRKNATVDVGKIPVAISFRVASNITFPDDLVIELESNIDQNITLTVNSRIYTVRICEGRGNLTIPGLNADTYTIDAVYPGDEDHFKAFNRTAVTINKMQVTLALENITDIMANEEINAKVILEPNVSPVTAQLYINGAFNKTLYLYDSVNNLTFRNLRQGSYTVTIFISQTENYYSANASRTFNVGRLNPKLDIRVDDIKKGENATVQIYADNFTGMAILSINGVNSTVMISNNTNITVANLEGGRYAVSVIFEGDSLYLPSNASATFNVIRNDPLFNVTVEQSGKDGRILVTTDSNCTGRVGVYVNFDVYYQNVTDGNAAFNVRFDSGTNYIFVFYDGDRNFENATYNTTVIIDDEFIIVAEDGEGYEYNDFTYSIVLVEKNRITMPNRNVQIRFNSQTYNLTTDRNGMAGITLNLASGSYTISATYLNKTVTNNILIKPVRFALEASDIYYGEDFIARATFEGNVTGNVSFLIGDFTRNVTISSSQATINLSSLKVGNYSIRATYFNDHMSKAVDSSFEVRRATPRISVSVSNIRPGEDEIIEADISDNLTGNITFMVNSTTESVEIANSKAVLKLSNLKTGIYDVSISYPGNENYTAFTYRTTFAVRNATSEIALNVNNTYYGQDATIRATLDKTAGGYITFKVSGVSKTVEVKNGEAVCTFDNLGAGTYRIDAEYEGDLTFAPSSAYGFFRVLKATPTIAIITDEVALGENIMIYAMLSPGATGEVYFSMIGYYSPRAKQIDNGTAFWYISPLEAGRYTVVATYSGDANYNQVNATYTLKVSQIKSILSVSINDASINDRVTANIRLTGMDGVNINGNVILTLNNRKFTVGIRNGAGKLMIGKMSAGNYIFAAAYEGNDEYSSSSASGSFKVAENLLETVLDANNVTAYYRGSQVVNIILTSNSKPVSDANVTVKINNARYVLTTDNYGKAALSLNLDPGKYVAALTFNETLSHQAASATAEITVLSTINATDVVKLYGSGTQYFAMFYKSDGKALGNTEVSFKLNGQTYNVKTLPNGVVRLNININPGTYKITAINPATGQKVVNTIRIYAKIMQNRDLTQYYGANKIFKVRIYNATTGKPVGKGVKVTFKVNKKTITAKTDKNGYASIKINLKAGKYTITTKYDGYSVSNRITVKPVLTAKNIIGKHIKKLKFKAKLVNKKGKALKGKKITFKFRGKTYKAKTNKKGIAAVILKNLKPGKFKIKTSYGKSKITNTIKIRK